MGTSFSAGAEAVVKGAWKRWSNLWSIVRTDGATFEFTDHNADIDFASTNFAGTVYSAASGFQATATALESGLRNRNLEMLGVIQSSVITAEDLASGLYDNADIALHLVDWKYPWLGSIEFQAYRVRRVVFTDNLWRAEVVSKTGLITQPVGEVYSRDCTYDLFDDRCGLAKAQHVRAAASVATVADRAQFTLSTIPATATAGVESAVADDHFNFGEIQWLTGNNAGTRSEIKDYVHASKTFTLQLPTLYNIQAGDTLDLYAGCDKRFVTCRDKFSNDINHGAFIFIPSTNEMRGVPKRHA